MEKCENCGHLNKHGEISCENCGYALGSAYGNAERAKPAADVWKPSSDLNEGLLPGEQLLGKVSSSKRRSTEIRLSILAGSLILPVGDFILHFNSIFPYPGLIPFANAIAPVVITAAVFLSIAFLQTGRIPLGGIYTLTDRRVIISPFRKRNGMVVMPYEGIKRTMLVRPGKRRGLLLRKFYTVSILTNENFNLIQSTFGSKHPEVYLGNLDREAISSMDRKTRRQYARHVISLYRNRRINTSLMYLNHEDAEKAYEIIHSHVSTASQTGNSRTFATNAP